LASHIFTQGTERYYKYHHKSHQFTALPLKGWLVLFILALWSVSLS